MSEEKRPFLEIVEGSDKGRIFQLDKDSVILGRSSSSDIKLMDPVLSRHHCRFFAAGGKWHLSDLDSANGTYMADAMEEVKEREIKDGDTIAVGDTRIRFRAGAEAKGNDTPVVVDLGFGSPGGDPSVGAKKEPFRIKSIAVLAGALALCLVAASMALRQGTGVPAPQPKALPPPPGDLPLEIEYEKIEAFTNSVFRYRMHLGHTGRLAMEIDDLNEERHVRKEAQVSPESVAALAKAISSNAEFMRTESISPGVSGDSSIVMMDLTVVMNKRCRRLVVENRVEPEFFREVRETVETFGKNELGIWAIQYPAEALREMAFDSFVRGRNFYSEREINYGNLYASIKKFEEAASYLETVEPKPDFYGDLAAERTAAEEELSRRYEERRFQADIAIKLKNWQEAAGHLRVILEQIPNASDQRNRDATRKLLDVENRIKMEK